MTLPVGLEGVTLPTFEVVLVDEPPTMKQPFTAPATYQHHWWKGKVKPIRVGPSVEHYDLHILWRKDKPLMNWILRDDIRFVDATPAIFSWCEHHEFMEKGKKETEYIAPGEPGNPSKDTPAYIRALDWGRVRIYEMSDMFVKLDVRMRKWRNHYVIVRRDPRLNLWTMMKEEAAP